MDEMNEKEIISELEKKRNQVMVLHKEIRLLGIKLSELTCPFKIGEIVTDRDGRKMVIKEFLPFHVWWNIKVAWIKKDGSEGSLHECRAYQFKT